MAEANTSILAYRHLEGRLCICGKRKGSMKSFCRECFMSLPSTMRTRLYNTVGYPETYWECVEKLNTGAA